MDKNVATKKLMSKVIRARVTEEEFNELKARDKDISKLIRDALFGKQPVTKGDAPKETPKASSFEPVPEKKVIPKRKPPKDPDSNSNESARDEPDPKADSMITSTGKCKQWLPGSTCYEKHKVVTCFGLLDKCELKVVIAQNVNDISSLVFHKVNASN